MSRNCKQYKLLPKLLSLADNKSILEDIINLILSPLSMIYAGCDYH